MLFLIMASKFSYKSPNLSPSRDKKKKSLAKSNSFYISFFFL
ncbi:hypothetical protein ATCC51561_1696 [Campylobacter concisus ATCC 51561]|nr:hypothetical protein ATCC51561_1696 [Campylobacter concisus ATCC 51561]